MSGVLRVFNPAISRSGIPFPGPQASIPLTITLSAGEEMELMEILDRAYERYRRELAAALREA